MNKLEHLFSGGSDNDDRLIIKKGGFMKRLLVRLTSWLIDNRLYHLPSLTNKYSWILLPFSYCISFTISPYKLDLTFVEHYHNDCIV